MSTTGISVDDALDNPTGLPTAITTLPTGARLTSTPTQRTVVLVVKLVQQVCLALTESALSLLLLLS